MTFDYINEAFKRLDLLNEDMFDTSSEGIQEFSDFMDKTDVEKVRVIDADANTEDDLKDSYIGKVIIDCHVCHSHIFKDKEFINIDENGDVNIDEQCPYCGEQEGFVIVGEITPFNATTEEPTVEAEEKPVKDTPIVDESVEPTDSDLNQDKKLDEVVTQISRAEYKSREKAVEDARKEVIKYPIGVKEEKTSAGTVETVADLSKVPEADRAKAQKAYDEYKKACKAFDPNGNNYDIYENLNESVNNVNVETDDSIVSVHTEDDGKVTVTTEPKTTEEVIESEIISPVSDETIDELTNVEPEAPVAEDEEETEFNIDEIDEESIDELGEAYLKRVYENVDSFKTTKAFTNDSKMIVEGVITFKSGTKKTTGFLFEAKDATKTGKVRFLGENKHLCKGSKAFTLIGKVEGNKLISESFSYNYRTKNPKGLTEKVHGTVRCKK